VKNLQDTTAQPNAFISVIICTCGRAAALQNLLYALEMQSYQKFEVLVIDGNVEPSPAREAMEKYLKRSTAFRKLTLIKSEKGLTKQRNVGLQAAKGDIICFFDDDVTVEENFLLQAAALFGKPDMQDVGGITPYDTLHYPVPVTLRWRLRALFGVMPSLNPGETDYLGRAVPLSFLKPWSGSKEIGWLPGFCMIFRRASIEGLLFDELLPTYGGEDRDFSMRVGERHRLLICGDLHLQHHYAREGRDDGLNRLRECSFGAGRRFAKYGRGFRDYLTVARTFAGDFLIDLFAFARNPRPANFLAIFVRIDASIDGLRSVKKGERHTVTSIARNSFERENIPSRTP
jgi:glycosyltransferase involved in cell wall biosynthesis